MYYVRNGKHDSISVKGAKWYDHKNQIGGGPVKLMIKHYEMNYQDAMQNLLGTSNIPMTHMSKPCVTKKKKDFKLPEPNDNMHKAYAYLIKQRFIAKKQLLAGLKCR